MKDQLKATFPDNNEGIEIPEWKEYTYEEFERHVKDVHSRRLEKKSNLDGSSFRNALRVKSYFDEFYDEPEATRKHCRFLVAMSHLEKMKAEYDTELFGIQMSDSFVASEGLSKAIHWYFCVLPNSEWDNKGEEIVLRIKEWARQWMQDHPKHQKD